MSCNKNPLLDKIQEGKGLVSTGIENAQSLFDSAQASIDQVSAAAQSAVEGIANGVKSAIGGVLDGLKDSIAGMIPIPKPSLRADLASIQGKTEEEIAAIREKWKDVPGIDDLIARARLGSLNICDEVPNVKLDEDKLVTEPVEPTPPSVNTEKAVKHEPTVVTNTEAAVSREDIKSRKTNEEFFVEVAALNQILKEALHGLKQEAVSKTIAYTKLNKSDEIVALREKAKLQDITLSTLREHSTISDSDADLITELLVTRDELNEIKLELLQRVSFIKAYTTALAFNRNYDSEIIFEDLKQILDSVDRKLLRFKHDYEQW